MPPKPPDYFSSLDGFETLFAEGIPVLNYHMIAPLPRDRKLKGLYATPGSFRHHLEELRRAGFSFGSLDDIAAAPDNSRKRVVITFDDGFRSVFEHAMEAMEGHGCRAIQFLVPHRLGKSNEWDLSLGPEQRPLMDAAQVRDWVGAGHAIGSHTLTHPYLTRIPNAQAREEIAASRKELEDAFGVEVAHFCYPYGDFNDEIRALVIEAGYRTACTVRFGVNTAADDPFALKRIKGRHPTRKLKSLLKWFKI